MPYVRFEPTIPASERAKTVHALDLLATVIVRNIIAMLKSRRISWTGYMLCVVETGRREGRSLGRPRHSWRIIIYTYIYKYLRTRI
jgi:hypothetical protein